MISSMTGFAEAQTTHEGVVYALEVRSLNHRYFKASVSLPDRLQYLEIDVERELRARLGRGSVTLAIRARSESPTQSVVVNQAALAAYLESFAAVKPPPGVHATVDLASLLSAPGVCKSPEAGEDDREALRNVVTSILGEAIDQLAEMRALEGRALNKVLLADCDCLGTLVEAIQERAPSVIDEYHERLRDRVSALLAASRLELDGDDLRREIAIFADRCDISEELVRLRCHRDQFVSLCGSTEQSGRKLDFLTQELLREANTIASKSNDSQIAHAVVEIKAVIDRLKEQVQNVV